MPAKSKSQQRLFGAVEGGATFPMANKIRHQMTSKQVRDFASTKRVNLPDRIKPVKPISPHRAATEFVKSPRMSLGKVYTTARRAKAAKVRIPHGQVDGGKAQSAPR